MHELTLAAWPFLLLGAALLALFSASLVWATRAPQAALAKPGTGQTEAAGRLQTWALVLLLPLAAVGLYLGLGDPRAVLPAFSAPSDPAARAHSVQALQQRLREQPGDAQGWLMLARSHQVLGQYAEANEAFEKAAAADPAIENDLSQLLAWAETRLLAADRQFDTRSHALVARALALDPEHPDVLLLAGLSALDRQDRSAATALFARLREHYPPGSPDREALDQTLADLAKAHAAAPGKRPGAPNKP